MTQLIGGRVNPEPRPLLHPILVLFGARLQKRHDSVGSPLSLELTGVNLPEALENAQALEGRRPASPQQAAPTIYT